MRENLRELVEQASGNAGARDDELISQHIAAQEAQLELLTKRREAVAAAASDKSENAPQSKRQP